MIMVSQCLWWIIVLVIIAEGPRNCYGHGRLLEPPSRSSMWRVGFQTPINYNDNVLNCGGLQVEWYVKNGKCGVCGDPWDQPPPRPNEDGGVYGRGIITRIYTAGQDIEVKIEITANHLGWFEFRLCPRDSNNTVLTQECFDQHLLQFVEGGSGTRYELGTREGTIHLKVRLPAGIRCTHCVFQWKYHGGNNAGGDQSPQEEFYGCSDIAIQDRLQMASSPDPPTFTASPPTTAAGSSQCRAVGLWEGHSEFDQWCVENCQKYQTCSPLYCDPACNGIPQPSAISATQFPMSSNTSTIWTITTRCYGAGLWLGNPDLDIFCHQQCLSGKCLRPYCSCSPTAGPATQSTISLSSQEKNPATLPLLLLPRLLPQPAPSTRCRAVLAWQSFPNLDQFCMDHCSPGSCPYPNCQCGDTSSSATATSAPPGPAVTTTVTHATPNLTSIHCHATGAGKGQPQYDAYCDQICSLPSGCNPQYCTCDTQVSSGQTSPHLPPSGTVSVSSVLHCHAIGAWAGRSDLDQWCFEICSKYICDPQYCACDVQTTASSLTTSASTPRVSSATSQLCQAIGSWAGRPDLDLWCTETCSKYICDPQYCKCNTATVTKLQPTVLTTPIPTTTVTSSQLNCQAVGQWKGLLQLDQWCTETCFKFICDPRYCICRSDLSTLSSALISSSTASSFQCYAIGPWKGQLVLDQWCTETCSHSSCDLNTCACDSSTSAATLHSSIGSLVNCYATGLWKGQKQLDQWCTETCRNFSCDLHICECDSSASAVTHFSNVGNPMTCYAVGTATGILELDQWCEARCSAAGQCSFPQLCACRSASATASSKSTTASPSTSPTSWKCHAINAWQGVPELDSYCSTECPRGGFCDPKYCQCDP